MNLQVGLGRPHHHHAHPGHEQTNSRQRRNERRAAARATATEEAAVAAADQTVAEEASAGAVETTANKDTVAVATAIEVTKEAEAEEASTEEASTEEVVDSEAACDSNENTAKEAVTDFTCDLCEKQFDSIRALRTHQGRKHKVGSPIPQLDGQSDNMGKSFTYTFVSEFALEDIQYTLREIFPHVETNLLSRDGVQTTFAL